MRQNTSSPIIIFSVEASIAAPILNVDHHNKEVTLKAAAHLTSEDIAFKRMEARTLSGRKHGFIVSAAHAELVEVLIRAFSLTHRHYLLVDISDGVTRVDVDTGHREIIGSLANIEPHNVSGFNQFIETEDGEFYGVI